MTTVLHITPDPLFTERMKTATALLAKTVAHVALSAMVDATGRDDAERAAMHKLALAPIEAEMGKLRERITRIDAAMAQGDAGGTEVRQ
jgi:hypothetical protein